LGYFRLEVLGQTVKPLSSAENFVDLLEATFDVHRHLIYQSLRRKLLGIQTALLQSP
jgi:hypothetical protein